MKNNPMTSRPLRLWPLFGLVTSISATAFADAPAPKKSPVTANSAGHTTEEFVGPFASWLNVKTEFGAVGDGKADDTAALQKAFDAIRPRENKRKVLFLPAGTYRITGTLKAMRASHHESLGVAVIGEDPAKTIIKWDGPQDGVMVEWGAWYAKISRLTLDGSGTALTALHHGRMFATANEISDVFIRDAGFGIVAGYFESDGIAETSVMRCRFIRCTKAAINIANFNSLDWWVRGCLFEDCGIGVTNEFGAGNFHIYDSLFRRSTVADITMAHTHYLSFRFNTSIGSKAFFVAKRANNWTDVENWGAQLTLHGNHVAESQDATPIRIANAGTVFLLDNTIISRKNGGITPAVQQITPAGEADMVAIGNTFTVKNPVKVEGRLLSLDNKIVSASALETKVPVLPSTPPNLRRRIFDVPPAAGAGEIQAAIDAASQFKGQKPVVHLPGSTYKIDRTLLIPAGCDVQLMGDGIGDSSTRIEWSGNGEGPMLRLAGPSRASVSDLSVVGNKQAKGIVVENCDQPGGRVWMHGSQVAEAKETGLLVNGVENAEILLYDFGHGGNAVGVQVIGGPVLASGKPTAGRVIIFSGASSRNHLSYDLSRGGRLLARDIWYETGPRTEMPQFLRLSGKSTFTLHGSTVAIAGLAGVPGLLFDNFQGEFSLLETSLKSVTSSPNFIQIQGTATTGKFLLMGNLLQGTDLIKDSAPRARVEILNNRVFQKERGTYPLPNPEAADLKFVRQMLHQTRSERDRFLTAIKPGLTDVRIHRIYVQNCVNGVEFRAN